LSRNNHSTSRLGLSALALALAANMPVHALTSTMSMAGMSPVMLAAAAAPPTITSFAPTSSTTTGIWVTIQGTNLNGGTVTFNGVTSAQFDAYDTYGYALLPAGATTGPIKVTTSYGSFTTSSVFTVGLVQAPTLTSFSPTSGKAGDTVTITGANFTGASAVTFNGVSAATYVVVSATQITAVVPATATTGAIAVTTSGGKATSSTSFSINAVQAPTLTSFSPTSGKAGDTVTITGTNLTGASAVKFNGVAAASYTVVSATQITAVVPATATTGTLAVITSGGTATSSASFTVTPTGTAPVVTAMTPNPATAYNSWIYITGSNLTGAAVSFNGVRSTRVDSYPAYCYALLPNGATSGSVTVTTPNGSTTYPNFTISATPSAPTFSSLSAASGKAGDTITITGNYFLSAKSVTFTGGATAAFTVLSETQLSVVVPAGAATGVIKVTTNGGSVNTGSFSVTPVGTAPVVSSFSPASGKAGDTITLAGSNFTGATAVNLGTFAASSFTVVSATQITAVVPAGAVTGTLSVINASGTGTSTGTFTVLKAPAVTGMNPTSGKAGDTVTLTGSGFTGTTSVKFGTLAATTFNVASDNSLTAIVPAGVVTATITVTNAVGSAASGTFTAVLVPAITGFSPSCANAGDTITLSGSGFTGATAVKFGTVTATSFAVVSDNQITAVAPAIGGVALSVTTPVATATSASLWYRNLSGLSFSGNSFKVGDTVTITGVGLTGIQSIKLNGVLASFSVLSDTQATFVIPAGASSGSVTLTTPCGTSTSGAITILQTATITAFSPSGGKAGDAVILTGTGFTGATAVAFNGTAAAFTLVSDTQITTSVPTGANTGAITVTTPAGVASTSPQTFAVAGSVPLPAPTLTSFLPAGGIAGDTIQIKGTYLAVISEVRFNGILATSFKSIDVNTLQVVVPVGATTGKVTVVTSGGSATSAADFLVTTPSADLIINGNLELGPVAWNVAGDIHNWQDGVLTYPMPTSGSFLAWLGGSSTAYTDTFGQTLAIPATATKVSLSFNLIMNTAGTTAADTCRVQLLDASTLAVLSTITNWTSLTGPKVWTPFTFDVAGQAGKNVILRFTSVNADATAGGGTTSWFVDDVRLLMEGAAPAPTATSVAPATAFAGDLVTLTGTNFFSTTSVLLNGTPLSIVRVLSPTQIQVVVPAGATTGALTVVTSHGQVNTPSLTVVPTAGNILVNGSFEQGLTGWTATGTTAVDMVGGYGIMPFTGKMQALLGSAWASDDTLYQDVAIPSTASAAHLSFMLWVLSSSTGTEDTFKCTIRNASGTVLTTPVSLNSSTATKDAIKQYTADLSTYKGQTVRITFEGVNVNSGVGNSNWTGWYVDDVKLMLGGTFTPTLAAVQPTSVVPGSTAVTITGTNLFGVTKVQFNGVDAASFSVLDAQHVVAVVPVGVTAGKVTVTTPQGTLTSTSDLTLLDGNLSLNGDFEMGQMFWLPSANVYDFTKDATMPAARSGSHEGWIGGYDTAKLDTLAEDITVPAGATSAQLRFWLKMITAETTANDKLSVLVKNPTTGAVLTGGTLQNLTSLNGPKDWSFYSFDMSPFAGQTVRVSFESLEVKTNPAPAKDATSWYVDDVEVAVKGGVIQPSITGFTPASGYVNEAVVTLNGSNLQGTTSVLFGNVPATEWTLVSATQITAKVPMGASTGKISIVNVRGNAQSSANFTVTDAPIIKGLLPSQGPVGTKVFITGTHMINTAVVNMGGMNVPFTLDSPTQISFTIPTGATTGAINVYSLKGASVSAGTFTVKTGTSMDLFIDNVTLTQATQAYDGSVPLVKDRRALARVFVRANATNTATPKVKLTLTNAGTTVFQSTLTAPTTSVPTAIDDANFATSWNFAIPASAMQPGVQLLAQVDPDNLFTQADSTDNFYPYSGTPLALDIKDTKTFKLAMVPLNVVSTSGNMAPPSVTTAELPSYMKMFQSVWPLPEAIDVTIHAPYTTSTYPASDYSTGWETVLNELLALQKAENISDRYYFGNLGATGGGSGMAFLATPVAMGVAWNYEATNMSPNSFTWRAGTVAHELGHSLSRPHSPCGGAGSPDPGYPYPAAIIGTPGYDVFNQGDVQTYAPTAWNDVMAYCGYSWVSDYCYKKVMDYRLGGQDPTLKGAGLPGAALQGATSPIAKTTEDCLLVMGTINEKGELQLTSSFVVNTVADEEDKDATYVAELKDARGVSQVKFRLEPTQTDHSRGLGFCKAISMKGLNPQGVNSLNGTPAALNLSELRISRNNEVLGHQRGRHGSHAGLRNHEGVIQPAAFRVDAKTVRFTWDASAHPAVMIRNAKREVIAFASGGSIDLATDAKKLEVSFSDSLTSITQFVEVH
jgi:hypothetical protein